MKVLAVSGSLRAASINSAFLRAAVRLAPPGLEVTVLPGLGDLPLFNVDLESAAPRPIVHMKEQVAKADALLIASPEYAHGVTGVIKNMLDWLVSFEAFVGKPVAIVNTSPRATHTDLALRETLKTMSAFIVEEASVSIPLLGARLSEEGMVQSAVVSQAIVDLLKALQNSTMSIERL